MLYKSALVSLGSHRACKKWGGGVCVCVAHSIVFILINSKTGSDLSLSHTHAIPFLYTHPDCHLVNPLSTGPGSCFSECLVLLVLSRLNLCRIALLFVVVSFPSLEVFK